MLPRFSAAEGCGRERGDRGQAEDDRGRREHAEHHHRGKLVIPPRAQAALTRLDAFAGSARHRENHERALPRQAIAGRSVQGRGARTERIGRAVRVYPMRTAPWPSLDA